MDGAAFYMGEMGMGESFGCTTQKARKEYDCFWCGEKITPGWFYTKWAWKYDDGDVETLRVHAECKCAWDDASDREGWYYETMPYEHDRGCCCEHGRCECGLTREQKLHRHCVQKGTDQ